MYFRTSSLMLRPTHTHLIGLLTPFDLFGGLLRMLGMSNCYLQTPRILWMLIGMDEWKWIHIHIKITLKSNFQHFTESCFTSVPCREFPFMPNLSHLSNFRWNTAEIDKVFTQDCNKWENLSFNVLTFHTNGENRNHIYAQITEIWSPPITKCWLQYKNFSLCIYVY